MNDTTFIYALNDPRTGECRYVGKADEPRKRLRAHIYQAKRALTHRDCWIRGLLAEGLVPIIEVLDTVPKSQWEFWETEYIRVFRAVGVPLTNLSDGGDGGPILIGKSHPRFGKTLSTEHREKIRLSLLGHSVSSETRNKLRAAQLGRKHSEETRNQMRETRGRKGSHKLI